MIVNTLNFKEVAPQFEGVLKSIKNLSNIYLKSDKAFDFGIDFLDKYFEEIAKYSYSDYREIETKTTKMDKNFYIFIHFFSFLYKLSKL